MTPEAEHAERIWNLAENLYVMVVNWAEAVQRNDPDKAGIKAAYDAWGKTLDEINKAVKEEA